MDHIASNGAQVKLACGTAAVRLVESLMVDERARCLNSEDFYCLCVLLGQRLSGQESNMMRANDFDYALCACSFGLLR